MSASYTEGRRSRRSFVNVLYRLESDDRLMPAVPSCCPRGSAANGLPCNITIDHFRARKTGPSHSLAVARCRRHGCAFTLYPPGYAPYRQQPVLKLAPDGSAVCTEEKGLGGDFSETVFHAALDGSNHLAWARDGNTVPSDRYWSTQVRHVGLAAALVGVARDLTDLARDTVATAMSANRMTQRGLSSASGFRAVGTAVCEMLGQLRGSAAARASTLLFCGYIAGHWGEPLQWDEVREDLLRSPFASSDTAPVM